MKNYFIILLLAFASIQLAAQNAPVNSRAFRPGPRGTLKGTDTAANVGDIYPEIKPGGLPTYLINDLVNVDGVIYKNTSGGVLTTTPPGVGWEDVVSAGLDIKTDTTLNGNGTDGALLGVDTVLVATRAYADKYARKVPLMDLGSLGEFPMKSNNKIAVYGTSKVETGQQGFTPFVENYVRKYKQRIYPGNVILREAINQAQFLGTVTAGTWVRDRNYTNSLNGFELLASNGAGMDIDFNVGLTYATPEYVDLYFEGGGGATVNVDGLYRSPETVFETQNVVLPATNAVVKIRINIPDTLTDNQRGLFKLRIAVSGGTTKLLGMFASGDNLTTISNCGVFGSAISDLISTHSYEDYASVYGEHLPDLAYVLHGTNDKATPELFEGRLQAWVDTFTNLTADTCAIILSGNSPLAGVDPISGETYDSAAKTIDSVTLVVARRNNLSFISEYQLFGGSIERANAIGTLIDGTHYTPEAGISVGQLMLTVLDAYKRESYDAWRNGGSFLSGKGLTFRDVTAVADNFIFGSDEVQKYSGGNVNYVFGPENDHNYYSETENEGPWVQSYYSQADDKYNVYHSTFDFNSDNIFSEYNKTRQNISFWPREVVPLPSFDFNIHSTLSPNPTKLGNFAVHDGGNRPALTTFFNGVSTIFPSRFWSNTRNPAAADTKIGKIEATPSGYAKLAGTGYLVLELPSTTTNYEYIAGTLTIAKQGETSLINHESLIEHIKWQGYFFGSSHGTYNPRIEFEAGANLGYIKEGRIVRDVTGQKVYIVIGDGTKNWNNLYWAMVEDVYWGEHSRIELHTNDWDIYVSPTLPTGVVRYTGTQTDADALADVLAESNDANGVGITNLADPTNPQDAATKAYVDAKILTGTGTPEGAVTAPVGTLYARTDGGTGTTLYVKETGVGNTGWVAK